MDMKSITEMFATDADMERNGRWYRIGNTEWLLARAGGSNKKFTAAYAAASRPYNRQQQQGTLDDDTAREILVTPFVQHCVLNWRNAKGYKPEKAEDDVPFSKDAAKKFLMTQPDILMTLVEAAGSYQNYKPEDMEDDAKNL